MHLRPVVRFAGKLPKDGNAVDECEDAFCFAGGNFAVADGASEGIYSGEWARILAESYCQVSADGWRAKDLCEYFTTCQAKWQQWQEEVASRELPWFAREKLRDGSFATLAGLSFSTDESGAWTAFAYGDACIFVVRDDSLILSLPLDSSDQFDNSPTLLATAHDLAVDRLRVESETALPGDKFYLVTDALAQWFLATHETGEKPWVNFDYAASADFELFISELRTLRSLKNDDVTMVSIEVSAQA